MAEIVADTSHVKVKQRAPEPTPAPAVVKQELPVVPGTPHEWFRTQPRDMSLVICIDQTTTQIM